MQAGRHSRTSSVFALAILRLAMLPLAIAGLLTGCGLLPSTPTITVRDSQCSYSGPSTVPARLSLNWDIETRGGAGAFTFVFATLGPGKTKDDLLALQGIDLLAPEPSWYKPIHYTTLLPGRSTEQIDLGPGVVDRLDPIYILCVGVRGLIGVVGPIQVMPAPTSGRIPVI